MNIVVLNIPNKPFTNSSILAEPIDALIINTIIKERFGKTTFIDMDAKRMQNNINKYLKEDNIVIFIYDYQIPLHTTEAIENIKEIINNVNKPTKFIIIGKTSAYYYKDFIDLGIDIVFRKCADNINEVLECINSIDKLKSIPNLALKDGKDIYLTEDEKVIYNFNDLPLPDRNVIDVQDYMSTRTIITSRGCINSCAFCSTPNFFGNWTCKTPDKIIEEIKYLIDKFNTKKILFLDDNMTVNKNRMIELCKKIKQENIKCLFGCLSSIKCYDKETFKIMYESGFRWVHFGIESGSERILSKMNKPMDIDYIKNVINECKNMGYRVRTSIILDYPSSTVEDVIKTKELLKEIKPHEIRLHYLAYRVGTKVFLENKNVTNKSQYIHSNKPNIENKELSNEIENIFKELKEMGYIFIDKEIDYNILENSPKETYIASLIPIKYGMCWYE